jgi:hypothetical protein
MGVPEAAEEGVRPAVVSPGKRRVITSERREPRLSNVRWMNRRPAYPQW